MASHTPRAITVKLVHSHFSRMRRIISAWSWAPAAIVMPLMLPSRLVPWPRVSLGSGGMRRLRRLRTCLLHEPGRRVELVFTIELERIALQRLHHPRQGVPQGPPWPPAEHRPRAADIQRVMIVGQVDHPRFDEGLLTRDVIVDPRARFGHGLRDLRRLPLLSVDETTDRPLDVVVTQSLLFPDEQDEFRLQLVSSLDGQPQG